MLSLEQVVDMKNEASSGAGWTIGENGLPKLPVNRSLPHGILLSGFQYRLQCCTTQNPLGVPVSLEPHLSCLPRALF